MLITRSFTSAFGGIVSVYLLPSAPVALSVPPLAAEMVRNTAWAVSSFVVMFSGCVGIGWIASPQSLDPGLQCCLKFRGTLLRNQDACAGDARGSTVYESGR